jgi:hypothetical protein
MVEMHQTLEKALTVPFPGNYKIKLMYSIINTILMCIYIYIYIYRQREYVYLFAFVLHKSMKFVGEIFLVFSRKNTSTYCRHSNMIIKMELNYC